MQAVIMAAGLGTRLRPLTDATPKPMLPIAGTPMLARLIASLPAEVTEVILVVGYLQERIRAHFGTTWGGRTVAYRTQQTLDGTGGAVHACRDMLHGRFLVLNGDCLYDAADLSALAHHDFALLAMPLAAPARVSVVEADGAGNLLGLTDPATAPAGALVNTGAYALNERFFDAPLVALAGGKEYGLPQTLAVIAHTQHVRVLSARDWTHVGTPEDLAAANAKFAAADAAAAV